MAIYWFMACLVLLFIEISTVNLVSIWFAIGSLFAMILAIFTDNFLLQLIMFIVISIIALLITKPLVKKFRKTDIVPTNLDRVIGKRADVIKEITADKYGEVKVLGAVWTAAGNGNFKVGDKVIVKSIDGVKLIVEKEEK